MSTNPINTNPTQADATGGVTPSLDEQGIMTAIETIRQKLPFLLNLTPAERKGLAKLGDKSRAFVLKAVDVATQNPEALPRSHSVQDVRNIADVFRSMFSIRLALQQLYKQVDDTTTKIGSDAYAVARTVYAGTKTPVARTFGHGGKQSRPPLRTEAEGGWILYDSIGSHAVDGYTVVVRGIRRPGRKARNVSGPSSTFIRATRLTVAGTGHERS